MKGRLIKSKNKKMVFLCPDGCISDATPELLQSLLTNFQHFFDKQSWPEIDNWKKDTVTDMMFYPGKTLACITDDDQLIVFDGSVFSVILKPVVTGLLSCYEYGAKHDVNPEYIRALCRMGRIPGARKISGGWMIPENAPYPVSAERRRKDLAGVAGRPRGSKKPSSKEK